MKEKHSVDITEDASLVKRATKHSFHAAFAKQGKLAAEKLEDKKKDVLQEVVDKEVVRECLA
jgi:hypothetical protein